ncbi:MAG: hypothetical protein WC208_10365 [Gallionella sp.]
MDLVDLIVSKKKKKGWKLQMLYAVVMTNYRQTLGDKAWDAIGDLFGDESLATTFAFLMGMSMGAGTAPAIKNYAGYLTELTQELKEKGGK